MDSPLFNQTSLFTLWDNSRAAFKRLYRSLSDKDKDDFKRFCAVGKKDNPRFIEILKYMGQSKGSFSGSPTMGIHSKKELIKRLDEMTSQVLMLTDDPEIRDTVNLCRAGVKTTWKVIS